MRRAIILLGVVLHFQTALYGFSFIAPNPTIHEIMRDGVFAQKLIERRPTFAKVGGGYPMAMIGGTAEFCLMDKPALQPNPNLDSVFINAVGCLNAYTLFAIPICYARKTGLKVERGALIFGEYSRYHLETRIGQFRLPFSLYGAIGKFISPAAPWRSKMIGANNELELVAHGEETHKTYRKKSNKTYREKTDRPFSFLMGGQKSIGANTIGFQVQPLFFEKSITRPKRLLDMNFDVMREQSDYSLNIGLGWSPKSKLFNTYSSWKKDNITAGGQWFFEKRRSKTFLKSIVSQRGRIEISYDCLLPSLQIPGKLILGYGWEKTPLDPKENEYAAVLKIIAHKYCHIRVGAKAEKKSKKVAHSRSRSASKGHASRKMRVVGFMLRFDLIF